MNKYEYMIVDPLKDSLEKQREAYEHNWKIRLKFPESIKESQKLYNKLKSEEMDMMSKSPNMIEFNELLKRVQILEDQRKTSDYALLCIAIILTTSIIIILIN